MSSTTTDEVIRHQAQQGIPEVVISDNGPQFSVDSFRCFSDITSSLYHPRGNGEAECAVGTIKNLVQKAEDPYLALLAYCSTPLQNRYSPLELLMNIKLRGTVRIICHSRKPTILDHQHLTEVEQSLKQAQKRSFDQHHKIRELPTLHQEILYGFQTDREKEELKSKLTHAHMKFKVMEQRTGETEEI